MLGYKYTTEAKAINAQKACNAYYGIPKSPEDVTQNWCGYNYDISGFWYIVFDESIRPILGTPKEFTVKQDETN